MTFLSRLFFTDNEHPDLFWRLLHYFNVYRIVLSGLLVAGTLLLRDKLLFGAYDPQLFYFADLGYLFAGLAFLGPIALRRPGFNLQLGLQVSVDILFVVLLMHSSGGIQSGLGLLLLVSLAASGLIQSGRMTLFFASVASLAILLEHTYDLLMFEGISGQYVQAGMLSIGYFMMAGFMRTLAQSSRASEKLARERGIDLANMAQVNQMVIRDMQDGVLVVDKNGSVLSRNRQADNLLGLKDDLPAGVSLEACSTVLSNRWRAWREHPKGNPDLLFVADDGKKVRTRFVPAGKSGSGAVVIFLEDVSRIQEQARQLKLASLGRLTANIAHEIRNPLSSISYATELLLEDSGADPNQSRLLEIIRDNTGRLDSMVKDVLQLNRRDRANPERIDAQEFFSTFIDEFCLIQKVPHQAFDLELFTQLALRFDRSHLNQIMWNVCRNAWRHCRQGKGSIRISVHPGRGPDFLNIDIIDDGPGVPESARGHLFEPFFTTAESGTGLGLYIAREIADANGAAIDYLEDTEGAHFRITCRSEHADQ